MSDHPLASLMRTAMESIKDMVDVTTVVGDAVEAGDGSLIIPVSRVSFGFAAGGTEHGEMESDPRSDAERPLPFGGGSGAGVTVQPVGFLIVGQGTVRMLPVDGSAIYDRLLDLLPNVLDRLQTIAVHRSH